MSDMNKDFGDFGLRFEVDWEESGAQTRSRESAFGAVVLHLAVLVMVMISPGDVRGFSYSLAAQPVEFEIVELVPFLEMTPLYIPPGAVPVPKDNTPDNLTDEERARVVIRTPGGQPPDSAAIFSLPQGPREPVGGGEPDAAESLVPGTQADREEVSESGADAQSLEDWQDPNREVALLDIPRPEETAPGENSPFSQASPNEAIRKALTEGLQQREGGFVGLGPEGRVRDPNLNLPYPTILSDTRGVDFGPYFVRTWSKVERTWRALIPDSARIGDRGVVTLVFTILKNGDLKPGDPQVVRTSGKSYFDRAAVGSIKGSHPFPPLPEDFSGNSLTLQVTYFYNVPMDEFRPPSN